jgi:hypothetical protein
MPAYILETGRSYPNPIDNDDYKKTYQRPASGKYRSHEYHSGGGTGYNITFNDFGPGSTVMGKDVVYYIGDEEKQTVSAGSDVSRDPIYRWYRGGGDNRDHKYSNNKNLKDEDFIGESKKGKKVKKGYNAEPRDKVPVFFLAHDQANGSVPLYAYYNSTLNDTQLSTSASAPSGYQLSRRIGYIWTSLSAAQAYAGPGETPVPVYEYYRSGNTRKRDHFYTTTPESEVNLQTGVPGVADCKDPRDQEYTYVGILGYAFNTNNGNATKKTVIDVGTIGPTGICGIDRSDWYSYNGLWSYQKYRRQNQNNPPGVNGWGDPDNVAAINNTDAIFEWYWGLNGAVKAAIPRFLSFETMYDSQFVYYLFDTSYPWNGPFYSIQYALSDARCCPNTLDAEGNLNDCTPATTYHSHYYEIRQDSWSTTESTISLTDKKSEGINESFLTVDTRTKRVLFRYTNRTGNFGQGDTINGWNIVGYKYFGDELKVGYMELQGNGGAFSYNQAFTSNDGGTIIILAGYGIADKAAFFGVYEFKKDISYYEVEIDPSFLIDKRNMNQAEIEATINSKGEVESIEILNGGYGYTNPSIWIESPAVLTEYSANDNARQVLHSWSAGTPDGVNEIVKAQESFIDNPDGSKFNYHFKDIRFNQAATAQEDFSKSYQEREELMPYSQGSKKGKLQIKYKKLPKVKIPNKQLRRATGDNKGKTELRQAQLQITRVGDDGSIQEILIKDRGSGYDFDPDNKPKVFVVEVETEKHVMRGPNVNPFIDGWKTAIGARGGPANTIAENTDITPEESAISVDGVIGFNKAMMNGFTAQYPVGYIRYKDLNESEDTTLCSYLPAGCADLRFPGNIEKMFTIDDIRGVISASPAINEWANNQYPQMMSVLRTAQAEANSLEGLWGWNKLGRNNQTNCINIPQPKLYSVTRFYDLPCPYMGVNEKGETRAYGFMIYKYCGSKKGDASFRVSLGIKGQVTGSQGPAFMNWVNSLPEPSLTPTRQVGTQAAKKKTWPCKRGSIKGRCYRNSGDIIFVPTGTDENTYDWNNDNWTEYEQLETWLGQNLSQYILFVANPWTGVTFTDTNENETTRSQDLGGYTPIDVEPPISGPRPKYDCWDKYVRLPGAPADAPLDVYCAYPGEGAKTPGVRFWDVPELMNLCTTLEYVGDASVALNPHTYKDGVWRMGPYNGTMNVKNYNTGATITLGEAINSFGNPYAEGCSSPVFGAQQRGLKPAKFSDTKTRQSEVSWDPSDPTRPEYDPDFII